MRVSFKGLISSSAIEEVLKKTTQPNQMRCYFDAFWFKGYPVPNIPYLLIKYQAVSDLYIEWSYQLSSSIRTASIFRSQWSWRSVAHDTRGEEQPSAEDKSLFLRLSRGRRGHPDKGRIQQNGFRQVHGFAGLLSLGENPRVFWS